MSINKKIVQYLDYKGVSQIKFSKAMGLSEGILRKSDYLGSKHFKRLRSIYPDLSVYWLLFDEGTMLIETPGGTVNEPPTSYEKIVDCCTEVHVLQKKLIETQEKLIDAQELNQLLQQQIQPIKKHGSETIEKP